MATAYAIAVRERVLRLPWNFMHTALARPTAYNIFHDWLRECDRLLGLADGRLSGHFPWDDMFGRDVRIGLPCIDICYFCKNPYVNSFMPYCGTDACRNRFCILSAAGRMHYADSFRSAMHLASYVWQTTKTKKNSNELEDLQFSTDSMTWSSTQNPLVFDSLTALTPVQERLLRLLQTQRQIKNIGG